MTERGGRDFDRFVFRVLILRKLQHLASYTSYIGDDEVKRLDTLTLADRLGVLGWTNKNKKIAGQQFAKFVLGLTLSMTQEDFSATN